MQRNQPINLWYWPLITLIVVTTVLRAINLDSQLLWQDEVAVAMHAGGYSSYDVQYWEIYQRQERHPADLIKYMQLTPERDITWSFRNLAGENPQIAPGYVVLSRVWRTLFGDSLFALRALPLVFGILLLPAVFWLCFELFGTARISWIATALVAVSPFHVLYSREAREYSLWAFILCLSSVALLRALRFKTMGAWGWYALTVSLSLYVHLFSVMVLFAHALYVMALRGLDNQPNGTSTASLLAFFTTASVGVLSIVPWFYFVFRNSAAVSGATQWS